MPFHSDIQPHLYDTKATVGIAAALIAFLVAMWTRRPATK